MGALADTALAAQQSLVNRLTAEAGSTSSSIGPKGARGNHSDTSSDVGDEPAEPDTQTDLPFIRELLERHVNGELRLQFCVQRVVRADLRG